MTTAAAACMALASPSRALTRPAPAVELSVENSPTPDRSWIALTLCQWTAQRRGEQLRFSFWVPGCSGTVSPCISNITNFQCSSGHASPCFASVYQPETGRYFLPTIIVLVGGRKPSQRLERHPLILSRHCPATQVNCARRAATWETAPRFNSRPSEYLATIAELRHRPACIAPAMSAP